MSKKPTPKPEARAPEGPDEDAARAFPDESLSDDACYQNLVLADAKRESQRASDLSFERVRLERVSFRDSKLTRARLYDASFTECDLSGCAFEQAAGERLEFRQCRSLGIGLSGAVLDDLRVVGGDWRYALFLETRLKNTVFEGVNLHEASFQGANLTGVRFAGCELSRADFRDARLIGTDFRGSRIEGIVVHAANLKGAIIAPEQALDLVRLLRVTVA